MICSESTLKANGKWCISQMSKNGKVLINILLKPGYLTQDIEGEVALYPK